MSFDTDDFQRDVIERSHSLPVLVDFWAAWCGPCRVLGPVLEKLAGEADGRWALAKVDTEAHPDVATRYGIMSIPNVKLFSGGEVVNEFVGALPEAQVRRWLEQAIPSPHAQDVAAGRARLAAGDFAGAEAAATRVLEPVPGDRDARALLAEALLPRDPAGAERIATSLENEVDARWVEAVRTLARLASIDPASLPDAPARAPMLEASSAVRRGDYMAAMGHLLEVMRADRRYADGMAPEAGKSLFVLLGLDHPVTEQYQRRFASLLYV